MTRNSLTQGNRSQIQVTFKGPHLICALHCSWSLCDYSEAAPVPGRRLRWRLWSQLSLQNSPHTGDIFSGQSFYLGLSAGLMIIISGGVAVKTFSAVLLSFILSFHLRF